MSDIEFVYIPGPPPPGPNWKHYSEGIDRITQLFTNGGFDEYAPEAAAEFAKLDDEDQFFYLLWLHDALREFGNYYDALRAHRFVVTGDALSDLDEDWTDDPRWTDDPYFE